MRVGKVKQNKTGDAFDLAPGKIWMETGGCTEKYS
jgi:hypothetical protein